MAALGDSITVALNASAPLVTQPELSWSTGTDPAVHSLLERLRADQPSLTATNLAAPGARVADLIAQARQVPKGTMLVTVLLGANDACRATVAAMTSPADFRRSLRAGLTALARARVGTVVLGSVPDVRRLWEVGRTSPEAVSTWTAYRICPSMLADAQSTSAADRARRDAVTQRIAAYDVALAAECAAVSAASSATTCHYDGGAVTRSRFTLADVSTIDYFHPSPSGQARLAEVVATATGITSS